MPYDPHDQLENYVRERLLGRGGSSKVYLARCTRGRLCGRRVALKMIPLTALPTSIHLNHHLTSTAIHTRLHHPSIVSLLAAFNAADEYCQVLELCSTTLSSFMTSRNPRSLTESEARGVFKAIVDALVYLARERILHRDIKADNILLTEDGRIKLGDFGLAVKLEPPSFEVSTFCGTPNYLSPEVVRRQPYGATSDIWALGCLMITILTGQPPFQGQTVEDTFQRVRRVDYSLPDSLSDEAKNLVRGLLRIKPEHRTPVHKILSHTFFMPPMAITPLNPNFSKGAQSAVPLRSRASLSTVANKENVTPSERAPRRAASVRFVQDRIEPLLRGALPKPSHYNHNLQDASVKTKPLTSPALDKSPFVHPPIRKFRPAAPTAVNVLASLDEAVPINPSRKVQSPAPFVTDLSTRQLKPKQFNREPLTNKEPPTPTSQSMASVSQITGPWRRKFAFGQTSQTVGMAGSPRVAMREVSSQLPPSLKLEKPNHRSPLVRFPMITEASPSNLCSIPAVGGMLQEDPIPTAEQYRFRVPPPLSVNGLSAGVHHIRHGSIEFLPQSRGLRLDLRASERKAGRAGDKILQISGNGERIEIFHAPDLDKNYSFNTPIHRYRRASLPSEYWKHYRFAARFVDMARSRVPKFIIYTPHAKCTMMSNTPNADIELHMPLPLHVLSDLTEPAMRVRLCGGNQTVEISRFELSSGKEGRAKVHFGAEINAQRPSTRRLGEWTKKVLNLPSDGRLASLLQTEFLREDERQAILHLEECRVVCEKLEALVPSPVIAPSDAGDDDTRDNAERVSQPSTKTGPVQSLWESYATKHEADAGLEASSSCVLREGAWEDVLRSVKNPTARTAPTRLTSAPSTLQPLSSRGKKQNNTLRPSQPNVIADAAKTKSRHSSAGTGTTPRVETPASSSSRDAEKRFIPNLGWCIKRGDSMNGFEDESATYSVMFLDGTSLDVDAKKRFARFTDRHRKSFARVPLSGHVPRRVQERLAVFDEFRQLFDGETPRC